MDLIRSLRCGGLQPGKVGAPGDGRVVRDGDDDEANMPVDGAADAEWTTRGELKLFGTVSWKVRMRLVLVSKMCQGVTSGFMRVTSASEPTLLRFGSSGLDGFD